VAPVIVHETEQSLEWGFRGCHERSKLLVSLYERLATQLKVHFLDSNLFGKVDPADGIHFTQDSQEPLAAGIANKVQEILELDPSNHE